MDSLKANCVWLKADATNITHSFRDLKPGTYAIAVSHDLNGNHITDTTWVGIPKEPWGVSKNIRPKLRAPRFEEETRELDVGLLVAAAGFGTSGDSIDGNLEDELSMLNVNCRAVMELSLHFGRRLVQRGRGGIILFGSLVGYQGTPRAAHYAATKAYIQTFAEGLHREMAPKGVDVLASAPGPVLSGFGERARMQMGLAEKPARVARVTLAALGRRMTVTPGLISKFLTWSLMTAPRGLRVSIMGQIMGGMTRSHSRPA